MKLLLGYNTCVAEPWAIVSWCGPGNFEFVITVSKLYPVPYVNDELWTASE